ncbi:MAG: FAD-linked oxidase C-terminal domain-containing protein [Actinomycetaceae bacterium]|nr:FAD-linked oxidase C-terminal domain-containing protein [Actinomycetaceae bacterium]
MYSTDACNYRIPPRMVVQPATKEALELAVHTALENGLPLTARGAGTSCAGNAIGPGVVVDTARYLGQVLSISEDEGQATVQPGCVEDDLQAAAAGYGLRFGPDPSTSNRCTIGGMIGNNACGPHAQAWGRTGENLIELEVIDGLGRAFTARNGRGSLDVIPGLRALVQENLELIRTECGRFKRQVSGYQLEELLPERGENLARFLAGTEGTLAAITQATVRLVEVPRAPVLVALGYPDMIAAARDVMVVNSFEPLAVEGMDSRLVDVVRQVKGPGAVPDLPTGGGWLLIEVGGKDEEEALSTAHALAAAASTDAVEVYPPGAQARALWRIRADGAGLGGRTPQVVDPHSGEILSGGAQAWPGFEDAAVPPENLADYLVDFTSLMNAHGVDGLLYGHFGDGCVHVRLDLELGSKAGVGRAKAFLEAAADTVARHGGSISGEHGDGRARSELLSRMYSPEMIRLFGQVKALFDPHNLMNPGVLIDPDALDANLRRPYARAFPALDSGFSFGHDGGDFTAAVHRCTGVGKCHAAGRATGAWMCPSHRVTGEEKDATRGRARALQEVANGQILSDFSDPDLLAALDLCLSCKACTSDCPAGVNMAQYRSEALHRAYKGRLRPRPHYLLGRLPAWLNLMRAIPLGARLGNFFLGLGFIRWIVFSVFGLDTRRKMATFEGESFRTWATKQGLIAGVPSDIPSPPGPAHTPTPPGSAHTIDESLGGNRAFRQDDSDAPRISAAQLNAAAAQLNAANPRKRFALLWADSFSEGISSDGARATAAVLEAAGYTVVVPPQKACCGLTWISSGQLDTAKKKLDELLGVLAPFAMAGIPIIGVEPSCTATLREDLLDLLPKDPRTPLVSKATMTLAELLTAPAPLGPGDAWRPPDLTGVEVLAQPHCHHYSVMGWDADRALLQRCGATVHEVTGCCGLAGNYGMEKGHYEMSVAVAGLELLPALEKYPEATVLTDGFSCRTQVQQLANRDGIHLAQLLHNQVPHNPAQQS